MKKIIALVVAIVMMAAIAVPAFADYQGGITEGSENSTLVTYGVDETYVVVVPSKISMTKAQDSNAASGSNTITISAGYKIPAGKSVFVSVDSDNYNNGWYLDNVDSLDDTSDNLSYNLKAGETPIIAEEAFMEARSGVTTAALTVTLNCSTLGTDHAGTYEDVLTFTADVDTSTQQS